MPLAFVLANTTIGEENEAVKDIKKMEGVTLCCANYGVYDLVIVVKAETMDKLKEIVTWKIRRNEHIRSTLTMIIVETKGTPNKPLPEGFTFDKPTAITLLNAEIGSEMDVLKDIQKIEGVIGAYAVYGVYDIVIIVQMQTMDDVKGLVTERIRKLEKVRSTLTMIPVKLET